MTTKSESTFLAISKTSLKVYGLGFFLTLGTFGTAAYFVDKQRAVLREEYLNDVTDVSLMYKEVAKPTPTMVQIQNNANLAIEKKKQNIQALDYAFIACIAAGILNLLMLFYLGFVYKNADGLSN